MSLLHTVLLSFDPELGPEDVAAMHEQLRTWPEEIGGFEALALGPPLFEQRSRGYQWMIHIVVADEEALARYTVHPVHQRFARWAADHGATVLAFDYYLDGETVIVGPGADSRG